MVNKALIPVSGLPEKRKKLKKPNLFERSGKTLKGIGRKVINGSNAVVKKGVKLGAIGAVAAGGIYAAGASSRRYAKSPKPGEGRDLRDTLIAMSKDYYS